MGSAATVRLGADPLDGFRFHDLRDSHASFLVQAGVPLNTVRDLLGHRSLAMTLRYSRLSPDARQEAVTLLDRALSHHKSHQSVVAKETRKANSLTTLEPACGIEPQTC